MSVIRAESRFPRLIERARIRDKHRLPKHRREGHIPECYVPEADWLDVDFMLGLTSIIVVLCLVVGVFCFTASFYLGQVIVSAIFSAIWG